MQSAATLQSLPSAQRFVGAQEPPQSTSVSVPFLTTSRQVGTWQMLLMQTPLVQSDEAPQSLPSLHLVEQLPPQSTSVSVPFFAESVQVGT